MTQKITRQQVFSRHGQSSVVPITVPDLKKILTDGKWAH